jgi:hypothetical protein
MTNTYAQRERWSEYRRSLGLPVDDESWQLATAVPAAGAAKSCQTKLADIERQPARRSERQTDLYYGAMEAAPDRSRESRSAPEPGESRGRIDPSTNRLEVTEMTSNSSSEHTAPSVASPGSSDDDIPS